MEIGPGAQYWQARDLRELEAIRRDLIKNGSLPYHLVYVHELTAHQARLLLQGKIAYPMNQIPSRDFSAN